jgi:hypothetical protein
VNVSRSDELRAQLEAELAMVELEEEFLATKAAPEVCKKCGQKIHQDPGDDQRDLKERLRAARQRYRDLRAGVPAGEGDAVASPGSVDASANVEGVG